MVNRTVWLDAGLWVLSAGGLPALRIESVAARLGLTKGSFYHHFVDLGDYRRALLGHFEDRCTNRHIEANTRLAALPPIPRLDALIETVLADEDAHRGLEVVMRTWGTQDDDARDTVERVDTLRLGYLRSLFSECTDDIHADRLARSAYYLLLGSQQVVPPSVAGELRDLWRDLLAPLRSGHRV